MEEAGGRGTAAGSGGIDLELTALYKGEIGSIEVGMDIDILVMKYMRWSWVQLLEAPDPCDSTNTSAYANRDLMYPTRVTQKQNSGSFNPFAGSSMSVSRPIKTRGRF